MVSEVFKARVDFTMDVTKLTEELSIISHILHRHPSKDISSYIDHLERIQYLTTRINHLIGRTY
ncbi:hypothetical protein FZC78_07385 [Rossellomorea vietnamensis]|uniref:Uncharacterized protein n=1 Tax=Rossellomorea vietnamensis TaxID=218284 RepID=A0A5D4NTQ7_9BACI|nr:hypothetical protein [Rossellomorea vietnamensis]TYS17675.1 hypothetical protein FZC78_07385 [Rossellomorea vietnamensis]